MAEPWLVPCGAMERFPDADPSARGPADELTAELSEIRQQTEAAEYTRLLELLPHAEQQILAGVTAGKTQSAIGSALGLTQAAVSYRLRRAIGRLRFMVSVDYGAITEHGARGFIADLWPLLSARDVAILHGYATTGCWRRTAQRCHLSERQVRAVVGAAPRKLRTAGHERYARLFEAMQRAGNILSEVVIPRWSERPRKPARRSEPPPTYDGPPELRPLTERELAALRQRQAAGVRRGVLAEESGLDPAYMDFLLRGHW